MKGCVVGAGRMGRVHARALRELDVALVGMCDLAPASLAAARQELGLQDAHLFSDADEMLGALKPDVVGIATTAPSHVEYSRLALENGVPMIVCEKPLGTSVGEVLSLREHVRSRDGAFAVNHQMAFMPQYVLVKNLLDDGAFGKLTSMNVLGGNFGIAMNGCHYFDAFRFLSNERLSVVAAVFDAEELRNPRGPAYRDRSGVVWGASASGCRFHLDASGDQGHGMAVHYGTECGQIYVNEFDGYLRYTHREPSHADEPSWRYGQPWASGEIRFDPADNFEPTRALYSAVLGTGPVPTVDDGLAVIETLEAAHRSHDRGGALVAVRADDADRARVFPWA